MTHPPQTAATHSWTSDEHAGTQADADADDRVGMEWVYKQENTIKCALALLLRIILLAIDSSLQVKNNTKYNFSI